MSELPASPPVLLLAFNRPALLARVLGALEASRPAFVYIAADGPRPGHPSDAARCAEVRALAERPLPWPCTVRLLLRDRNVGLQRAVTTGIDWFFEHEPLGAILEDDCLPAPDFLPFAGAVLRHFEAVPSVMHISGVTLEQRAEGGLGEPSYRMAQSGHVWGWATWRRAWKHFDPNLAAWPSLASQYRASPLELRRSLADKFEAAHSGRRWSWPRAWYWSMMQQGGLSVIPNHRLIENIGVGIDATHSQSRRHPLLGRSVGRITWPLVHPTTVEPDVDYDRQLAMYHRGSLGYRVATRIRNIRRKRS